MNVSCSKSSAWLVVLATIAMISTGFAQPPDTLWTRTYGGDGADFGFAAAASGDGGYVLCGTTDSFSANGDRDVYLVKINDAGDTLWTRTYGYASTWEEGRDIAKTADGGYIIAGYTGVEDVSTDIHLLKVNSLGDLEWRRNYGGLDVEEANAVKQTSDGGYVIVGLTESYGDGLSDSYIIRTNDVGDTLWTKTYGGVLYEVGRDVVVLEDSGFAVASSNTSDGPGATGVELRRLDENGESLWVQRYGGPNLDSPRCLIQCQPSGFLIGGMTISFAPTIKTDAYMIRVSDEGDSLWMRTYGYRDSSEAFLSASQLSDGSFILAGFTGSTSEGADRASVYLVRTDSLGLFEWSAIYGGPNQDFVESVLLSPDGGYLLTGWSNSNDVGTFNIYTLRIDSELGIPNHNRSLIPDRLSLYAYPNPFNSETTLKLSLDRPQTIELTLYNQLGQIVMPLMKGQVETGEFSYHLSANSLPSGTYYAQLNTQDSQFTRKLILIK
jgi:hypothetical protein